MYFITIAKLNLLVIPRCSVRSITGRCFEDMRNRRKIRVRCTVLGENYKLRNIVRSGFLYGNKAQLKWHTEEIPILRNRREKKGKILWAPCRSQCMLCCKLRMFENVLLKMCYNTYKEQASLAWQHCHPNLRSGAFCFSLYLITGYCHPFSGGVAL